MLRSHGLGGCDDILHGSTQLLGGDALLGEQCLCIGVGRVQRLVIESLNDGTELRQILLSCSNQVCKECLGGGNHSDIVAALQGSLCLGGLLCQAEGLYIADDTAQYLLGKRCGSFLHGGHRSNDLRYITSLDGSQGGVYLVNGICCAVLHGIAAQVLQVLRSHGLGGCDDILRGSNQFLQGHTFLSQCCLGIGVGRIQRLVIKSLNNGTESWHYLGEVSLDGSFQCLGSLGHRLGSGILVGQGSTGCGNSVSKSLGTDIGSNADDCLQGFPGSNQGGSSLSILGNSQRAGNEGDVVVLGGETAGGNSEGATHGTLRGIVAGKGEFTFQHSLGLVVHEALVAGRERRLLTAYHHGIISLDGERRLVDVELLGLGAGVVALTCGGYLGSTGVCVVGISQRIVSALNQHSVAVLHSNSRLLLCAVIHILSGIKSHCEHCVGVGHDTELSGDAALEIALTSNGCSIGAYIGTLVACHLVALGRHLQVAGIDAGHLCCLLLLVVHQTGLSQRSSCQRSLTDRKSSRSRALIVANACSSHLSSAGIHVVLKGQGIVGGGLHHGLAVLHHHSGNECVASIDRRRDFCKHAIRQRLGRNNQRAPVGIAKVVVALSHVGADGYLTGTLDGHLASGGVNRCNFGVVRLERQLSVAIDTRLQDEVSIAKGLRVFRGIEQHRTLGLDNIKLHLFLASIASADAREGGNASTGIGVVREGHGIILSLNKNGLTVLYLNVGAEDLTRVGHIGHRDADVGMGQQFLVGHLELGAGALHLEGESVLLTDYRRQLYAVQHVDVALCAARCLCHDGNPLALGLVKHVVLAGGDLQGDSSALRGFGHLTAADQERHGAVSILVDRQVVGGYGVRPCARRCCYEQHEQTK